MRGAVSGAVVAGVLAAVLAGLWPGGAAAGVAYVSPQVQFIIAGAICVDPPDRWKPAPGTKAGRVQQANRPYRFSLLGDRVPDFADTGIGLDVTLRPGHGGETVSYAITKTGPGGWTDRWQGRAGAAGRFWFSNLPDPGRRLNAGHYILSARAQTEEIITYDFDVIPPSEDSRLTDGCTANIS